MRQAIIPASIIALVLAVILLDKLILPLMEDHKCFWGAAWTSDDKKLFKLNCMRNWASRESPLFQSHTFQPKKNRSGPRILVMGDSFVWGDGYANVNDLWWRQLSRELVERGYEQVEVLAAGYPSYSMHAEVRAARQLISQLKPDLVIWGYTDNDPDEGLVSQSACAPGKKMPGLLCKLLPNLTEYMSRQQVPDWLFLTKGCREGKGEWEMKLLEGENFKRFSATVADLGELLQTKNTPGIVTSLPLTPNAAYYRERFDPVRPLFERANVPFVDLAPALECWYSHMVWQVLARQPFACLRPAEILQISPANGHPSAMLTHFYAEKVADLLEKNYKRVLGRRRSDLHARDITINDCVPVIASVRKAGSDFEFTYPPDSYLLRMPIRRPYVQMNLETPCSLKRICLSGEGLQEASCYVTVTDSALSFDTGNVTPLPQQAGSRVDWDLAAAHVSEPVNTILISASFSSATNHRLRLRLEPLHGPGTDFFVSRESQSHAGSHL